MLKYIFYAYELFTSLKINFHKSQLIGLNISDEQTEGFAAILGYKVAHLPIQYLGIPLHHSVVN